MWGSPRPPRRERGAKTLSPPEDVTADAPAMEDEDEMEVGEGFGFASEMEE